MIECLWVPCSAVLHCRHHGPAVAVATIKIIATNQPEPDRDGQPPVSRIPSKATSGEIAYPNLRFRRSGRQGTQQTTRPTPSAVQTSSRRRYGIGQRAERNRRHKASSALMAYHDHLQQKPRNKDRRRRCDQRRYRPGGMDQPAAQAAAVHSGGQRQPAICCCRRGSSRRQRPPQPRGSKHPPA